MQLPIFRLKPFICKIEASTLQIVVYLQTVVVVFTSEQLKMTFNAWVGPGADPDIRHIRMGECQILWPKNCPL